MTLIQSPQRRSSCGPSELLILAPADRLNVFLQTHAAETAVDHLLTAVAFGVSLPPQPPVRVEEVP